jgi:hypothetical protein
MAQAVSSKATQEFVPIKEVRDGIVILKDNSMRSIVLASSLNFALKSADEQEAIIAQFQNFLNSLNFSVQIFVQSRRLDIRPYIALLEQRQKEQMGDLLKVQTKEYIEFIKSFTDSTNIMTKSFFIVIPYTPAILNTGKKGTFDTANLLKKKDKKELAAQQLENFDENRSQLEQRIEVVEQGLVRCGIRVVQLGTEELVELYYKIFNPGDVEKPIPITN